MTLPRTERTIQRNTGVLALSGIYRFPVTFTYTDDSGVSSRRKGYTVTNVDTTGRAPGRAVITATSPSGAVRRFRNDRVLRTVKGR